MMEETIMNKKPVNPKDILDQYVAQTAEDEDVHFEHYDWTYNDSSCCC